MFYLILLNTIVLLLFLCSWVFYLWLGRCSTFKQITLLFFVLKKTHHGCHFYLSLNQELFRFCQLLTVFVSTCTPVKAKIHVCICTYLPNYVLCRSVLVHKCCSINHVQTKQNVGVMSVNV